MDKIQFLVLFILAIFGGIFCDTFLGNNYYIVTIILVGMTGVMFYVFTKEYPDEEE